MRSCPNRGRLPVPAPLLLAAILWLAALPAAAAPGPARPLATATRAAAPVLLVDDSADPEADAWYGSFMDMMFGAGDWDGYEIATQGLPDPPELFLATLAQYQAVLWYADTGTALHQATPQLLDYLDPMEPGVPAGRLIVVLPTDRQVIPMQLMMEGLGLYSTFSPPETMTIDDGRKALGFGLEAIDLVAVGTGIRGLGLQPLAGAEIITRLEYCMRCYSLRPPFDPVVGVRRPDEHDPTFARTAAFAIPLHRFGNAATSLQDLMKYQMGIIPVSERISGAEHIRLAVNDAGYVGSFFLSPDRPSLVYPYPSHVENLYHGGLWIGARRSDGSLGVSTSADQYGNAAEGEELREFAPTGDPLRVLSNIVGSELYDPAAVAPWQVECSFHDEIARPESGHVPLGLTVHLRAMSWNSYPYDDAVVLEYRIVNTSGDDLRDVYVGFYADMTVGNTEVTSPYGNLEPGDLAWNWYDDVNGAWRPGDFADDPDIWMMWEHDADGDGGAATSWIGCRLLGSSPPAAPAAGQPPVSYNAEVFRSFPTTDDAVPDTANGGTLPGRYQMLANGDFDVGATAERDFTIASDWAGLLATGPVPVLAPEETLRVTFALIGGEDGWNLRRNARRIQDLAAAGYLFDPTAVAPGASGPPAGPRLGAATPNPFNPRTTIAYEAVAGAPVRLCVFDVAGRLVRVLVDEPAAPGGRREATWDGRDDQGRAVAAGAYFCRLEAGGHGETRRMMLVR